jgi:hypothetical protein
MPQPAREALRPGLVDVLSRSARPESMNEHLRSLRVRAGSGHEIIARELYLPALHRRIDSTQDDAGFVEACDHMVDAAVAERRITEELRSLLSRHGRRVTSHDAERWMGVARQHQATAGLRKLFEAASLIRSPELDEPSQDASELPPGVPVGQAPLRRPRGPTPVSVGPIALSMWLALLAGVVLSTAVIWPFHRPQPLWWLVPALPPLGWWVLERVIRMLFVDPRYFSIVRATRWACLCLIVASILLGGWLFWSAFARTSWAALPMGGTHG